jgi:hypothetical protein
MLSPNAYFKASLTASKRLFLPAANLLWERIITLL